MSRGRAAQLQTFWLPAEQQLFRCARERVAVRVPGIGAEPQVPKITFLAPVRFDVEDRAEHSFEQPFPFGPGDVRTPTTGAFNMNRFRENELHGFRGDELHGFHLNKDGQID